MFSDLGTRVVAADLDPQANLTAAFLDEDRLVDLWPEDASATKTVYDVVQPLLRGVGDVAEPYLEKVNDTIALLVGDLALSTFEDELSNQWPACLDRKERAFRVISAFWRILKKSADLHQAPLVLVDLGPNLGAINRAALIAADYVIVPLSPDLFSLQGLKNLGPRLRTWREEWQERLAKNPDPGLRLPQARMEPAGYIVLQHSQRLDRPARAYEKWISKIPQVYRQKLLDQKGGTSPLVEDDPSCLALLKHYRSLMPMAQEARKPLFHLKPADGAIGSHLKAVQLAYGDFRRLANEVARRVGLDLPVSPPGTNLDLFQPA